MSGTMKLPDEKDLASQNLDEELQEWEEERRQNEEYKGLLFPGTERWISKPGNVKRLIVVAIVSLVIFTLGLTGYRKFNAGRAEKMIQESWTAFTVGDSELGNRLLAEARNIAPSSTPVLRTFEIHQAKAGDKNSLQNLLHRMDSGASDADELLGIAEIEVNTPGQNVFSNAVGKLPINLTPGQSLRLNLVEAAGLSQKGKVRDAAAYCLSKAASAEPQFAARLNAQGALYLFSCNDEAASRRAATLLLNVAKSNTAISIQSWRILAKMVLSPPPNALTALSPQESQEVVSLFPSLHDETLSDQFIAADIAIHLDPTQSEDIAERLVSKYRSGERQTMLDLAWWLNARGFYSQAISLAGSERPLNDTDWLLVTLYAQDAQGKWGDVDAMLDSSAAEGIPDAMRFLILARSAMAKGDQSAAEEAWRNVDGTLYLETSSTLVSLARFEEHVGAWPHAKRTYTEMVNRDETKEDGLKALIRLEPPNASAQNLIPLYKELIQTAPDLEGAREDLIYLKLLADEDTPQAIAEAKELFQVHPDSLESISIAALADLRSGDKGAALKIYQGKLLDWAKVPDSWKVIRSAVLRAAGDTSSAEILASTIDESKLRPESRELLLGN